MRKPPKSYEHATSGDIDPRLRSYLRHAGVLDREETGRTCIASQFPLVLYGVPGTGKSCAAAVVYRQWPSPVADNRDVGAFWWRLEDFISLIQRCRTSRDRKVSMLTAAGERVDRDEAKIWQLVERDWLFCIDDIGLRDVTPAAYEIVFRLVDARQRRPTIITSNLSPEALGELYDDRIASRLCGGTVVEVTGADRRVTAGKRVRI